MASFSSSNENVKGLPAAADVADVAADVDENECSAEDMCQNGQCVNIDGSFKCLCETGYTLSLSGKQCAGTTLSLLTLCGSLLHPSQST